MCRRSGTTVVVHGRATMSPRHVLRQSRPPTSVGTGIQPGRVLWVLVCGATRSPPPVSTCVSGPPRVLSMGLCPNGMCEYAQCG